MTLDRHSSEGDSGAIYRVVRGGKVDKLRDEGLDAAIGRESDMKVIREVATDGGEQR